MLLAALSFAGHHEATENQIIFTIKADVVENHAAANRQIQAYSTAAPDYIEKYATVIRDKGEVLRKGTNNWTCMAMNSRPFPKNGWKDAHEAMPGCVDSEGLKWMNLAMNSAKPELERDAYIWMLRGDVGEDNTKMDVLHKKDSTLEQWIESGAHLTLMPKDPASVDKFHADLRKGEPYVMMPDSDYVHLMIPLVGYYKYQPNSAPTR